MTRKPRRRLTAAATATVALVMAAATGAAASTPGQGLTAAQATTAAPADTAAPPSTWWYSAMGYDELHRYGTGKGITVAVLDDQVDPDVPELKGRLASVKTFCDKGTAPTASDTNADHGTNVASMIVGTGQGTDGRDGVRGIAPDATLRYYTVAVRDNEECSLAGQDDLMARTLDQAVKDGAKIVSMSFDGTFFREKFIAAVARAQRAGVILVSGTDDHGSVGYPALANGVVSVNYVDRRGKLGPGAAQGASNAGFVDIAAPGVGMLLGSHVGGGWKTASYQANGSSLATPLVSGGLAAVWSHFPRATANQLLQMMVHTPGLKKGTDQAGNPAWVYGFRRVGSSFPAVQNSNGGYGWGIFDPADMMYRHYQQFPDTNPMLVKSNDPALKPTWSQVTGQPLPGQSASATAPSGSPATAPAGKSAAHPTKAGGSVLPWVAVGVLVVLLVAGGAAVALRGRRGANAPTENRQLEGSSHGAGS